MNAILERDPRVDPVPDDLVTVGEETREVLSIEHGRVYYSWPGKVAVRSLHLSAWRAWAAQEAA